MDKKTVKPKIVAKVEELMKARGWDCSEGYTNTYAKDGISINVKVEGIGYSRWTDMYRIAFYRYRYYNRFFKVAICNPSGDDPTFTVDETKLDRKIAEVSAILKERKESEQTAVEFATEIGVMFPQYKATPLYMNAANVELPGGRAAITRDAKGFYFIKLHFLMLAAEAELVELIKTIAQHS